MSQSRQLTDTSTRMPKVELNLSMDSISLNYQGTAIQNQFYTHQNFPQRQRGKCHNCD